MPTVIIEETVEDYATWRTHYDRNESMRAGMGVTGGRVYQSPENNNHVCIVLDVDTLQNAQGLTTSTELREAMKAAGVVGTPRITIADTAPVATH